MKTQHSKIYLSWLKSCLNERDNLIVRLKKNVADLERHLEAEMVYSYLSLRSHGKFKNALLQTTRTHNAQTMKQLLDGHKALYPGLLNFGDRPGSDPFHEVAHDLLRQHKISEQMEMNEDDKTTSSHVSEDNFGRDCQSRPEDAKVHQCVKAFIN